VDVLTSGLAAVGVKRLEWVPLPDLRSRAFVRAELHLFAGKMVVNLGRSLGSGGDILGNLPRFLASMEPFVPPPVAPGRTGECQSSWLLACFAGLPI
jgi:hypothetical protein